MLKNSDLTAGKDAKVSTHTQPDLSGKLLKKDTTFSSFKHLGRQKVDFIVFVKGPGYLARSFHNKNLQLEIT